MFEILEQLYLHDIIFDFLKVKDWEINYSFELRLIHFVKLFFVVSDKNSQVVWKDIQEKKIPQS